MPKPDNKDRKKTSVYGPVVPPVAFGTTPGTEISAPIRVRDAQEAMLLITAQEQTLLTLRFWVADFRAENVPDSELPDTLAARRYYPETKVDGTGAAVLDVVTVPATSFLAPLEADPGTFVACVPYDVHAGVSHVIVQPQGAHTTPIEIEVLRGSAGGF